MVKKTLIFLIALFVVSFISAEQIYYKPNVNIQSQPGQNLIVRIADPETQTNVLSKLVEISSGGTESFSIETGLDIVQITILFIKNASNFMNPDNIERTIKRGTFSTKKTIVLNLNTMSFNELESPESETIADEGNATDFENNTLIPLPLNDSENNSQEEELNPEEDSGSLTGASIKDNDNIPISLIGYIVGGAVLVGIFIFLLFKRGKDPEDRLLIDAEKRLKIVDAEINKIKNRKKKINEVEEKLKKDDEELKTLKDSDFSSSSGNY